MGQTRLLGEAGKGGGEEGKGQDGNEASKGGGLMARMLHGPIPCTSTSPKTSDSRAFEFKIPEMTGSWNPKSSFSKYSVC